jgi:DTW domain-containing protein YfiP
VQEYIGGGYLEDVRWKKEEEDKDEDGNVKRLDFMKKLKLAPFTALESQEGRKDCPVCKKSCKYYCYVCMLPVMETSGFPQLVLPIDVTVVSHPKEKKSKSSIIPSKIICPNQVEIVSTTEAPELRRDEEPFDSVVLLFPSDNATEMTQMSEEELKAIKKVVLIDSTWNQTKAYLKQPNIAKLKMVKIQTEKTVFWRYQTGELDTSLATIEALYFFFRDYDVALNCLNRSYSEYRGTYDNILWFYAFNFKLIQDEYTKGR